MVKRTKHILLAIVLILVLLPLTLLAAYLVWLTAADYRPPAREPLSLDRGSGTNAAPVPVGTGLSLLTYNIGFGAYDHEFTFFMDGGKQSIATDRKTVLRDIEGSLAAVQEQAADFIFLQEIDIHSTRSWNTDQYQMVRDALPEYTGAFAVNYDVPWIAYPLNEMHGRVYAGLSTLSRYTPAGCERVSLPIDESWPARLFGLDRCLIQKRLPTANGRELVLLNMHLSAYDSGGQIRERQLAMLKGMAEEEYARGNYVIIGGDWNHVLPTTDIDAFQKGEPRPEWFSYLPENFTVEHFRFAADPEVASTRSDIEPYDRDYTFTAVIDGFLVSDNIEASAKGIDLDFLYSDHNPVRLDFVLK